KGGRPPCDEECGHYNRPRCLMQQCAAIPAGAISRTTRGQARFQESCAIEREITTLPPPMGKIP
ncbi:MAG: hypothetical protein ACE5FE_08475, partial [Acidiferrobacterales bacterium]